MPLPRNLHRCYAPPKCWQGEIATLDEGETKHLLRVLRAEPGDTVLVFDGEGREALACLRPGARNEAEIEITEELPSRSLPLEIELVQALPKQGRMEMILQKATELGARAIQPLLTENTVVKLEGQRARRKEERWRSILIGAAKQCGVSILPKLKPIEEFDRYLAMRSRDRTMLICSLEGNAIPIKKFVEQTPLGETLAIDVLVGPEGDFSDREYSQAIDAGAIPLSLGDLVLRTDTAAFYILSVLRFAAG